MSKNKQTERTRCCFHAARVWSGFAKWLGTAVTACWQQVRDCLASQRKGGCPSPMAQRGGYFARRRTFLRALGGLPLLGLAGVPSWKGRAQDAAKAVSTAGITLVNRSDLAEGVRLRNLDLADPKVAAARQQMPAGRIGPLTVSRLISGSNLISMNMHARDPHYVTELARHYNTEERVFMTLKKAESLGVNTIVLKHTNFRQFQLAKYWKEWGGKMQWIADLITTDVNRFEALLVEHLELGAAAAYVWGGASDTWFHQKKPGNIIKAYEILRKHKIPAGIAAHRLEPIAFCEKEGIKPDFYFLTLHHDRYWSAHPKANRTFLEMFEPESPDHAFYHDNMFCHEAEATVRFMENVEVPWIAFKVLAAGAIRPQDGMRYAYSSGADFVCLGMFDWQVAEDVELTRKCVAEAWNRSRVWT